MANINQDIEDNVKLINGIIHDSSLDTKNIEIIPEALMIKIPFEKNNYNKIINEKKYIFGIYRKWSIPITSACLYLQISDLKMKTIKHNATSSKNKEFNRKASKLEEIFENKKDILNLEQEFTIFNEIKYDSKRKIINILIDGSLADIDIELNAQLNNIRIEENDIIGNKKMSSFMFIESESKTFYFIGNN